MLTSAILPDVQPTNRTVVISACAFFVSSVFLSWNLVLFLNNRVATLIPRSWPMGFLQRHAGRPVGAELLKRSNNGGATTDWEQRWAWTRSVLDILQDICDFFGSGLDLDIYFWNKLDQGICLISITKFSCEWFEDVTNVEMMVQVFSLLCFFIHKKIKMILSVCAALITINDNSCYLIVNFFPAQMEEVNCSYVSGYAALLCWVAYDNDIYMCVMWVK